MRPLKLRDPAPSRWAYRVHRLWLTPFVRNLLRVGLPSFIGLMAGLAYFGQEDRMETIRAGIADIRRSIESRPEFTVRLMAIDGASAEVAEDIREILPIDFPVSSFDLDLPEMHRQVSGLGAVARADLRIKPGGVLQVTIDERQPAVVWRGPRAVELLDAEGHRVAPLPNLAARPAELPLIAGEGADLAVREALALHAAAEPVAERVLGLVRVSERRWDLVLDRGQRILLPETGAVTALNRVLALHEAQDLLGRDVAAVDFRNARRPTVRLAPAALEEIRRIRAIEWE